MVVLNVIPFSLGIENENGEMEVIIPRNSTIPTKRRKEIFSTFKNNIIKVYEGENKLIMYNNLINEIIFDEIEPMIKNKRKIEITFDLDVNLILNVSVKKSNGKYNNYMIKNKRKLSQNEIDKLMKKIEGFRKNIGNEENKKKEENEENKENEKKLKNRNEIIFLEKEIQRLKQENRILIDRNEKNIKIIIDEKIINNNILNNKLDDLNQNLNIIHQEKSKLKLNENEY